jgi:cell division protein FtsA
MIAKARQGLAPEIVGVGISKSKGLKNGVITSLEYASESINEAVNEAEKQANVKLSELYVGIAGNYIKGETSRGIVTISRPEREITYEDVHQVIEQATFLPIPANREIIDAIPQEFIVDDQPGIKDPVGMNGNRLEATVYVITGVSSAVQNICKAINRAGFKVREIILQSMASSYAVLEPDDMELGCMVVDIGGGTTDGVVFYEGSVRDTFTINLGGMDVTNDISIGLTVSRHEAEEIKIKYGVANMKLSRNDTIRVEKIDKKGEQLIERKKIASIITPRVEEIFGLVSRRLRYTDLELLPSGIILTGGMAKMPGIEETAERILGVPVKVGILNAMEGLTDEVMDLSFSSAIGLITYGVTHKESRAMGKDSGKPFIWRVTERMKRWLLE